MAHCWLAFENCHSRWCNIKALPGANRLIKHLSGHRVPLVLASNSPRENIETKISFHQGILLQKQFCSFVLDGGLHTMDMHWGCYDLFYHTKQLLIFLLFLYVGWKESFFVIIGCDEIGSGKPSPEMWDATTCCLILTSLSISY